MTFNKPSEAIQMSLFPESKPSTDIADFVSPKTYAGLAGFHKYWGKKPIESISYLIEKCTNEGDIVMDVIYSLKRIFPNLSFGEVILVNAKKVNALARLKHEDELMFVPTIGGG